MRYWPGSACGAEGVPGSAVDVKEDSMRRPKDGVKASLETASEAASISPLMISRAKRQVMASSAL